MKRSCIACTLLTVAPAFAHHSAAAVYVMEKTIHVEGTVTRFNLGNPHMRIYFTRTDQKDRTSEWVAEGGSRTVLLRRGWKPDTVKPGDHIVLVSNPARDDRKFVHVTELTLPDGNKLATEDLVPSRFQGPAPAARGATGK